jgi:CrcB protein
MKNILLVGIGGAIGSIGRYMISLFYQKYQPLVTGFPYPTFIANMIGCIIIGAIMAYILKTNQTSDTIKFLLVTGFCGGFTTFSALSFESVQLLQNNQISTAFIYIALSVILGLGLTFMSYYLLSTKI